MGNFSVFFNQYLEHVIVVAKCMRLHLFHSVTFKYYSLKPVTMYCSMSVSLTSFRTFTHNSVNRLSSIPFAERGC